MTASTGPQSGRRSEKTLAASGAVVALARGVLRAMLLSKVKLAGAGLLILVAFATTLARSGSGPERPGQKSRSTNRNALATQAVAIATIRPPQRPRALQLSEHARAQLGSTRLRHGESVRSVTFSPDGRTIAAARGDRSVHLWDLASGKPLFPPGETHESEVSSVAISADGCLLATRDGKGTIHLWDAARGERVRRTEMGEVGVVGAIRFAPDGRTLGAAAEYSSPKSHGFRGIARLLELPREAMRRE